MSRRAIILAGGKGQRLRPYTVVLPKPLMPIGDFPILEVVVRQLVNCGFDHITLAVNHQAEIIKAFFNSGKKWGVKIDYSLEKTPLGTMGPLKLIDDLPDNFLVMNGDVLTDLNFGSFFNFHSMSRNLFTISSFIRTQKSEYGVLKADRARILRGFQEKPAVEHEVSMGVYMLHRKVLDFIPNEESHGFDDLMRNLIGLGVAVKVRKHEGFWLDIGRPDDYMQAIEVFDQKKSDFLDMHYPVEQSCGESLFSI